MRTYYAATVAVDVRVYVSSHLEVEPTLAILNERIGTLVSTDAALLLEAVSVAVDEEERQEFEGELDCEPVMC